MSPRPLPLPRLTVRPSAPPQRPPGATRSRQSFGIIALLVWSVMIGGCRTSADSSSRPVVRDSAGVTIVEQPSELDVPVWSVSRNPVLRIGDDESDPAQHFQSISGALRLSDGRHVVLDGLDSFLRYFDPDGGHIATVGRQGAGPGELHWPYRLIRLAGDSIGVADSGNNRLSIFDPSGTFVRSHRIGMFDDRFVGLIARLDDTLWLGRVDLHQPLPDEGTVITPGALVRLTDSATAIDTIVALQVAEAVVSRQGLARNEFHGFGLVAVGAGRIASAWSKSTEVRLYSPSGALESVIRLADTDQRFTSELRAAWMEQMLQRFPEPDWQRRFRQTWEERPMPDSLPAFAALEFDDTGHMWIGKFELLEQPVRRWTVLNSAGVPVAEVDLPWRLRVMQIGDDFVLGTMLTALDVQTLAVFELDRRNAGRR